MGVWALGSQAHERELVQPGGEVQVAPWWYGRLDDDGSVGVIGMMLGLSSTTDGPRSDPNAHSLSNPPTQPFPSNNTFTSSTIADYLEWLGDEADWGSMAEGKLSSETQYLFGACLSVLGSIRPSINSLHLSTPSTHRTRTPTRPPIPLPQKHYQPGNHFGPAWEAFLAQYERPPCRTCQVGVACPCRPNIHAPSILPPKNPSRSFATRT